MLRFAIPALALLATPALAAQEVSYDFAFAWNDQASEMQNQTRLREEANAYCVRLVREAGVADELATCRRTVVLAVEEQREAQVIELASR